VGVGGGVGVGLGVGVGVGVGVGAGVNLYMSNVHSRVCAHVHDCVASSSVVKVFVCDLWKSLCVICRSLMCDL
jgi:hypothetical protein